MPFISDTLMDVLLQYIIDNGDGLNICDTVPTTYTEAITTYMLAQVVIDSGDYTLADGDVDGRKVTVGAQSSVSVTNAGTSLVAALTDSGNSELLVYAECSAVELNPGNTVNTTSFKITVRDAA